MTTKDCSACGQAYNRFTESDPCLGSLPGVLFACCGHGEEPGYMLFSNGVRLKFKLLESKVVTLPPWDLMISVGGGRPMSLPKTKFNGEQS